MLATKLKTVKVKTGLLSQGSNDLTITLNDKYEGEKTISINAKTGDDIEELATYINGQTDMVKASVDEDGKLQLFTCGRQSGTGQATFGGSLAGELGFGEGKDVTVKDIDVTSVGGAQQSVAIVDAALKFVDSHRAELGHSRIALTTPSAI